MVQRHGTAHIGRFFGPVMTVWFLVLAALGAVHIASDWSILRALSPHYALRFLLGQPAMAFVALGAVVLCVTGAEALYADMGHFGKRPIRIAWFGLAMPALVLNYFGQGAMLLAHPEKVGNPFFELAPDWALYPLIGLATCAAVIASQALITAAFSITKQVIQLGYLPRLRIMHTSVEETGQIYLPFVNWALFGCIVLAVVLFGSSNKLAGAYGIAVTIDMTITTVMTFFVIRYGWKYPWAWSLLATGLFFIVDFTYFGANIIKVFDGGWFPLLIGGSMFTLMMTWKQGRNLMSDSLRADALDLESFLESVFLSPPTRVPGTAVFLVSDQGLTPNALLHNLKHNKVLHETNLFVTVKHHEVPWIARDRVCEIEPLGHDCWQVTLNFGFKNEPDVPAALAHVCEPRRQARRHGHLVFPVARHHHSDPGRRPRRLAREAVCRHAPQRLGRGRLPQPAGHPRGRARIEGRDLSIAGPRWHRLSARSGALSTLRLRDVSLSAAAAGFVAVLVGFTSSVAIVFQAATAFGATPAQVSSWMWALGWGMGLCTLLPSLWLKKPVMIAWSTPGAALLATAGAGGGFGMADAVGAFIVCAALMTVAGATGWFERVMQRIPLPLASALLAGVLVRFALDSFVALQSAFALGVPDAARLPGRAPLVAALRGAWACSWSAAPMRLRPANSGWAASTGA